MLIRNPAVVLKYPMKPPIYFVFSCLVMLLMSVAASEVSAADDSVCAIFSERAGRAYERHERCTAALNQCLAEFCSEMEDGYDSEVCRRRDQLLIDYSALRCDDREVNPYDLRIIYEVCQAVEKVLRRLEEQCSAGIDDSPRVQCEMDLEPFCRTTESPEKEYSTIEECLSESALEHDRNWNEFWQCLDEQAKKRRREVARPPAEA